MYHAILLLFSPWLYSLRQHLNDDNIKPLQIIQRKAIQLITFSNYDAHIRPLFAKLNLFKLQDHIKLQTLFLCSSLVLINYQRSLIRFLLKHLENIM